MTIFWEQNPFPQQSIFDAPTAGQHFITQLVCAGDISGKGKDAGKVLAHFSWNSDDMKGSIKAVKVPDFKEK